jgi:purine-binding chemotaxis protein CheW
MHEQIEEKYTSDLMLEKIRSRKAQEAVVDVEEETVKVVIFSLHGDLFAFSGESVKKLLPPLAVYYVPGSPDFIPGVINVRGQIESVLNINRFLGLPDAQNAGSSRIAVAEKDGFRSGILIDFVEDVADIPIGSIKPPLGTLSPSIKEFVTGEFFYRDHLVILLDIGRIFRKIMQ